MTNQVKHANLTDHVDHANHADLYILKKPLKSPICGIVYHACQTLVHCPSIVSSFELSSGTICLLRLCLQKLSYKVKKIIISDFCL